MILEWQTIPIREVYAGMFDGPHATPKPSESGPIFLGIKNVGESGQLDLSDVRHISEEEYPRWIKRVEPRYGDIVFSYEATLNRYAMIPKGFRGCLGRRMALIRPDESKAYGRFLYYYFFGQEWRNVIAQNTLIGSTVDRIPIAKFPDFPITIPPLPIQRKIAAILSAYDDLIENNLRRIKILEETAQTLYRGWFGKFRFPGHRKVKMVNSPLGKIPKGWKVLNVENIVKRHPPGKLYEQKTVYAEGTVPVLDQGRSGVIGYHNDSPGVEANEENPVIIFANHTCYQRIIHFPFSAIQNVLPFYPNPDHYRNIYWLHYATKDLISFNDYKGHWPEYMGKKVVVPTIQVAEDFGSHIKPNILLVFKLQKKCKNLSKTRDLLLPKLISGELDVSELDITIPEANA
jgi:type I restriction enzyme S subunit